VYRSMTTFMAGLMILLGVSMLLITVQTGFGVGIILGLLFVAAGVGRLYLLRKRA
jgi:hypothetical protein